MENIDKFEQVFLYVLSKVGGKPNVGETVLHKLMYFIDFDYYEKHDESLTGIFYKKNRHGLTFDSSYITEMERKNLIKCIKGKYGFFIQKKYKALEEPKLEKISAFELQHIDKVLHIHSDKNANQIEEYSHKDVPWVVTKDRETIQYESVFYRTEEYSVKDLEDEL